MPTIAFLIAHDIGHARHVLKFDENFQIVPSKYKRLNWNVECGKGIDDLLLNIKKGKVTRENFNQR